MSQDFFAAQKAVDEAVTKDPELLEKIRRDHEAQHRTAGNGTGA